MSIRTHTDRTLAFAGILQALQLVQATAYGKPCDAAALQASLHSILKLDAASVEDVYGGAQALRPGLRLLQGQLLDWQKKPDPELSRYLVTLLHLERKLARRPELLERIRTGVSDAQRQLEGQDITGASVLAELAETYSETVSTLQPRIMVNGDPARLADAAVASRIRALLLAAMRSAVLWRQCGGSRIGLLLGRQKMLATARQLLL